MTEIEQQVTFNYNNIFDAAELLSLKNLLADDSMSILVQSNNPTLLADTVLWNSWNFRLSDMFEYKNDSFLDTPVNTGDDNAIYIPLYYKAVEGRTIYYLDIQRLKYSYYNHLFTVLDYLLKPNRLNLENRSFLIVNNTQIILEEFITKFCIYIDKYSHSHYFMFLATVASRRPIWHKLNTITQQVKVNISRECARQVIESNYGVKTTLHGKMPLAKFTRLIDVLYTLFNGDLVKIDLLAGHALSVIHELPAGTLVTDKLIYEMVILQIPALKLIAEFIRAIRKIQAVTDLQLCYSTAFRLNSVNYTPAYVFRLMVAYIGLKTMYQGDFHCLAKHRIEFVKMVAETEIYTTRNDTDYIVIFQKYLIELAKLVLKSS